MLAEDVRERRLLWRANGLYPGKESGTSGVR